MPTTTSRDAPACRPSAMGCPTTSDSPGRTSNSACACPRAASSAQLAAHSSGACTWCRCPIRGRPLVCWETCCSEPVQRDPGHDRMELHRRRSRPPARQAAAQASRDALRLHALGLTPRTRHVELAAQSAPFADDSARSAENFYASWQDKMQRTGSSFEPPAQAWLQLRRAAHLHDRAKPVRQRAATAGTTPACPRPDLDASMAPCVTWPD